MPEYLPRVGPSFGWLLLFFILFFGAAILYIIGYGAVLGYQSTLHGTPLPEPEQIGLMIQEHLSQPAALAGLYHLQCLKLFPIILGVAYSLHSPWQITLGVKGLTL